MKYFFTRAVISIDRLLIDISVPMAHSIVVSSEVPTIFIAYLFKYHSTSVSLSNVFSVFIHAIHFKMRAKPNLLKTLHNKLKNRLTFVQVTING